MADDELAAIRARRMAEMQQQHAARGGMGGQPGQAQAQAQAQEEKRAQMEDMKNSILSQVLSQEARARLNTIAVAKPEKAQRIEAAVIQMAQTGQLGGKLSEEEFIGLLERFSGASAARGGGSGIKVNFDRRRNALDSDSD